MRAQTIFVACVFLFGAFVAYAIGAGVFGMEFDAINAEFFIFGAVLIGGFPAILAALPARIALFLLGAVAVLLGLWGASVLSTPGDGAIGGFLVLFVDVVLVLYGLAIIALRKLIIKKPASTQ